MICESWGCIFASLHSRPRLDKMSTFSANLLVPRSRIFVGCWGNDKILWSSEAKNQQLRMADFDLWSSCSDFLPGRFVFPHPYIIDLPLCRSICVLWNGQSSPWTMRLVFVVRGVHTWISWISVGSWQLPLSILHTYPQSLCFFHFTTKVLQHLTLQNPSSEASSSRGMTAGYIGISAILEISS